MINSVYFLVGYIATGLALVLSFRFVFQAILDLELRQVAREEAFQKWLFDALYSINNKVVLPDSHEIKEDDNMKASVYSPEDDPMTAIEGVVDDWHK